VSSGLSTVQVYWPNPLLNFAVLCMVNICELYHVPKQSPEIKIALIVDNTKYGHQTLAHMSLE
jgi:hypothetical protein